MRQSERNKSGGREKSKKMFRGHRQNRKRWLRLNKRCREREKGERRLSPSRRTKDGADNGEAFSEAEVAGRSIFSPVSMQPRE